MKALITGSSGFIGKHLLKRLEDWEILTIPHEYLSSRDSITRFLYENNNTSAPIDYIFNIQAYGNMHHQQDFLKMVQANISNTVNLLDATKGMDYKGFIQFGSSSEYGPQLSPMSETSTLDTKTFYSATKASATHIVEAFRYTYKKPCTIIRPFSVYGPLEAHFRFIPTVILCTQRKQSFYVDEHAVHDWIYIDDFIDGVMQCIGQNSTFNIGSGIQTTNSEIVAKLSKIMNCPISYEKSPSLRKHDSHIWQADITKMISIGWKPKHTIEEGLAKTYEHYKKL